MILEDDVLIYVEESGLPFPVYMDEEDTVAGDYSVPNVPLTVFITKEGKVKLARPFTYAEDLAKIIDALAADKEIDTSGMQTLSG